MTRPRIQKREDVQGMLVKDRTPAKTSPACVRYAPDHKRKAGGAGNYHHKKEIVPGNGILKVAGILKTRQMALFVASCTFRHSKQSRAGVLDNAKPELSILGLIGFFVVPSPAAACLTKFRAPKERSIFSMSQFDRTGCAPGTRIALFDIRCG